MRAYLKILMLIVVILLTMAITWAFATRTAPIRRGDVNGDGKIDEVDIKLIQEYILKMRELSDDEKVRADMNRDGKISALDMLRIQRHILGVD